MTVYRLCRRPFADLSGEGARIHGARYNAPGERAVYTAEHLSLAVVELLVHLRKNTIPDDYVVLDVEIDGHYVSATNDAANRPPAARVPSAVVPREFNIVLYPDAPNYAELQARITAIAPFTFDPRFFVTTA